MLPLVVSTMLRCNTDRMATGHSTARRMDAVLWGPGRNAACTDSRRPLLVESAAVTSAPYTGGKAAEPSGGTVSVGPGQLAAVEVADERWYRAGRVDAGTVADALPHHPLAGGPGVDDGGRRSGDAFVADDRVVLHTQQQHVDLQFLWRLRCRTAGPVHALDQVERRHRAELWIELGPGHH